MKYPAAALFALDTVGSEVGVVVVGREGVTVGEIVAGFEAVGLLVGKLVGISLVGITVVGIDVVGVLEGALVGFKVVGELVGTVVVGLIVGT